MACRFCRTGVSAELARMLTENCWPASFSASVPLTGVGANVPEPVNVMFTLFSGLAAASLGVAVRQDNATAPIVPHVVFRKLNENIPTSSWPGLSVALSRRVKYTANCAGVLRV